MTRELYDLTALELSRAYGTKEISPVEVTRAVLSRIETCEPKLNAMYIIDAERALAQAAESETRWRESTPLSQLDGVPITIKDRRLGASAGSLWHLRVEAQPGPDTDLPAVSGATSQRRAVTRPIRSITSYSPRPSICPSNRPPRYVRATTMTVCRSDCKSSGIASTTQA
jgi:hypothetical protein